MVLLTLIFHSGVHGTAMLTDDLDVLVMESTEANLYESGNDATALGHTTILDATSQSWSYQFAESGTYSVIFDNTDEPDGGAGDGYRYTSGNRGHLIDYSFTIWQHMDWMAPITPLHR